MPKRVITAAVGVAGLVVVGLGVASATIWRADDVLVATATPASHTVVTEPGVLELGGDPVTVRVSVPDGGPVTLAVGRDTDVEGWIGTDAHTVVTGLSSWDALATSAVTAPSPSPTAAATPAPSVSASPSASASATPGAAAEPTAVDPAGSDMWVAEETGEGSAELVWPAQEGRWSLIAVSTGESAPTLELAWPRVVTTPWLWPCVVVGSLIFLAAAYLLYRDFRRHGRAGAPVEWTSVHTDALTAVGARAATGTEPPTTTGMTRRQLREAEALRTGRPRPATAARGVPAVPAAAGPPAAPAGGTDTGATTTGSSARPDAARTRGAGSVAAASAGVGSAGGSTDAAGVGGRAAAGADDRAAAGAADRLASGAADRAGESTAVSGASGASAGAGSVAAAPLSRRALRSRSGASADTTTSLPPVPGSAAEGPGSESTGIAAAPALPAPAATGAGSASTTAAGAAPTGPAAAGTGAGTGPGPAGAAAAGAGAAAAAPARKGWTPSWLGGAGRSTARPSGDEATEPVPTIGAATPESPETAPESSDGAAAEPASTPFSPTSSGATVPPVVHHGRPAWLPRTPVQAASPAEGAAAPEDERALGAEPGAPASGEDVQPSPDDTAVIVPEQPGSRADAWRKAWGLPASDGDADGGAQSDTNGTERGEGR